MADQGVRAARRAESSRRILEAARAEFAERGFDAATIRAIAARAEVDPALVMQHFGSKEALFRSAARLDALPSDEVDTHLHDVVMARLDGLPPELHALVRSMLTTPAAADAMRDYLDDRVSNLAAAMDDEARATVLVCTILGLTIGRHFLQLSAFDRVDADVIAHIVGTVGP